MDGKISKKKQSKTKELILQIPITLKDIHQQNNLCNDNINTNNNKNINDTLDLSESKNVFTIGTSSTEEEVLTKNTPEIKELIAKLDEKENLIRILKDELKQYKHTSDSCNTPAKILKKIDFKVKIVNNIIDYTPNVILCWWCHHSIPCDPVFLPDKFDGEHYYVSSIFCSLPCATSYNAKIIDDYKTSERYTLLKQMYKITDDIYLAPDWRFLKNHGGYMSIEEFRSKSQSNIFDCTVFYAPFYFQGPYLQEINKNLLFDINNKQENLVKRSKPLPRSKNTLAETMGLQIEYHD